MEQIAMFPSGAMLTALATILQEDRAGSLEAIESLLTTEPCQNDVAIANATSLPTGKTQGSTGTGTRVHDSSSFVLIVPVERNTQSQNDKKKNTALKRQDTIPGSQTRQRLHFRSRRNS